MGADEYIVLGIFLIVLSVVLAALAEFLLFYFFKKRR